MDITALITTVNELVVFKNSVITLSKRIFQLPASTAGIKTVAVHNASSNQTEQFNLTDALNGMYSITNQITALGAISRVDDTFTFGVGFQWRLNGINYANALDIDLTIDGAGDGNHRIDIAVLDENNDIYIIQGFEVPLADTVVQPLPEPNTLFLCSFIITEATIGDPAFGSTVLFLQKVRIRKGFGKFNVSMDEAGDIFQFGFIRAEDSVKCFADFAVYIGGDINDNNNFTDMTVKEITFEPSGDEFAEEFDPEFGG